MNPSGEIMISVPVGRGRGSNRSRPEAGAGAGPWRQNQDGQGSQSQGTELRRPLAQSPHSAQAQSLSAADAVNDSSAVNKEATGEPSSSMKDRGDRSSSLLNTKLSADAKEFVPRSLNACPKGDDGQQDVSREIEDTGQLDPLSGFLELMGKLTHSPGQFSHYVNTIFRDLIPVLDVEEMVQKIVSAIIEQAIAEPNFRYSGAKLCCVLSGCYDPKDKSVFRGVLLTSLCEEHQQMSSNLELEPGRVYGFVHFLAEVYSQLQLNKGAGCRIQILGEAVVDALELLITIPTMANIKTVCNVLKLTGYLLDSDMKVAMKANDKISIMDGFILKLKALQEDPQTSSEIKAKLSEILELRDNIWGYSELQHSNASSRGSSIHSGQGDGVMYGPDGSVLTQEECLFLRESTQEQDGESSWDGDDDPENEMMDPEMMAAFEEFLDQQESLSKH